MSDHEPNSESEDHPEMADIPPQLHSDFLDRPFQTCIECSRPLLEGDVVYAIQKDYHGGECILEFAICLECMESMNGDWSEESRQSVEDFLASHAILRAGGLACDLCGRPAEECEDDFAVAAIARGGLLLD